MKRKRVSFADLVRDGVLRPGEQLVIHHRSGKQSVATVTKAGALRVGRQEFSSPSRAASATLGGTEINGWVMWKCHRNGEWRHINELRTEGCQ